MIGSQRYHIKQGIPIYLLVLALMAITGMLSSTFLTLGNLGNVADRIAPLAVTALAQTVCILSGGTDLSLGAIVSLATVILSFTGGAGAALSLPMGIMLCLVMGLLAGLSNGLGITYLKLPPLIMTLSTSAILQGVALYLRETPGGSVNGAFCDLIGWRLGFLPVSFLLCLLLYGLIWWVLSFTRIGRSIYAVGGHPENARKCGISIVGVRIRAHMLGGALASIGGMMLAARVYSGDPVIGLPMGMDSVAATLVGGTAIVGGIGGPVGTLAGAILLSMMSNLLNLLNVYVYYQYILRGLILCGALVLYQLRRKEGGAR
ncbi:MAG: ABC transporter permease [Bacillota bacterium]